MRFKYTATMAAALLLAPGAAMATTITIATVNNPDMIVMQKLSHVWEKETGNTVKWVVLPENVLHQRVTTDIATHSGEFDIVTLGSYSVPIWAKQGWLEKLNNFPASYNYDDILPPVRQALSYDGTAYAAPFYAESSFTMYRKDLFKAAGLTMPDNPTYQQIEEFADKLTDKSKQQYGICLRGQPGWGENMAYLDTLVNTYGGSWFNMSWQPQLDTPAWHNAINFYVDLMKKDGPPGATSDGFDEMEALFSTGHCAIWIDSTVAAGKLEDPTQSQVAGKVGFANAPVAVTPHGSSWLWVWALAIPSSTHHVDTAKSFIAWATSAQYVDLVGKTQGWVMAPPGTRQSTYQNPNYLKAASFAPRVLNAIESANPKQPTLMPVPYTGIQFVDIAPFQQIGTTVGQDIAAALSGDTSVDAALKSAQQSTLTVMQQAGYLK